MFSKCLVIWVCILCVIITMQCQCKYNKFSDYYLHVINYMNYYLLACVYIISCCL